MQNKIISKLTFFGGNIHIMFLDVLYKDNKYFELKSMAQ